MHANVGLYLKDSPMSEKIISVVLNLSSGLVSPQCCQKIDNFSEVVNKSEDSLTSQWKIKRHFGTHQFCQPVDLQSLRETPGWQWWPLRNIINLYLHHHHHDHYNRQIVCSNIKRKASFWMVKCNQGKESISA